MEFMIGAALLSVAGVIWFTQRNRPVRLRSHDDGTWVMGPPPRVDVPDPTPGTTVRRVATMPEPSSRLARVLPGHQLRVEREQHTWIISDADGRIAHVGGPEPSDGEDDDALVSEDDDLLAVGTLHVDRVLKDADHNTVDLRGVVEPDVDEGRDEDGDGAEDEAVDEPR